MRTAISRLTTCLLYVLATSSCGGDDDPAAASGGFKTPDPALGAFCTGVLVTPQKALPSLPSVGGGTGWGGTNNPIAPAGTSFLLESDAFGSTTKYRGYVYVADGRAAQISGDFTTGLVKDTDFTTECDVTKKAREILLVAAVVRPNQDLTGDPCTLPVGTDIFELSVARTGEGPITLSGAGLATLCTFEKGYTDSLTAVSLIAK